MHRSSSHQEDQAYDKYKSERKQSRSTRQNEEEDRSRNERRTRSSSRCDIVSTVRDRSRFRRSRSNSSSNRATKEEQDFNENKFSSRRNRSHKPYDRVSHAELVTSYPSSFNFYDTCMRFPGPMPMCRMQTPPMMWPIAPRPFLPPFPPNMIRWRPNPLRFSNVDRGFYRN